MPEMQKAVGLIMLVMLVAFMFPALMTSAEDGRTVTTDTYNESDVKTIGNALVVETNNLNVNDVVVNLTSVQSGNQTQFMLTAGETHTATLDNRTVNVTAVDLTTSQAVLRVDYPTTFGWSDSPKRFADHLPLVILGVGVAVIIFLGGAMLK